MTSLAKLLDAIYEDPFDDAPRLVYADALQEGGDPRGEFIALQLAPTSDPKREQRLLSKHARTWLGTIDPIVEKEGLVFRRGFVARLIEVAIKNPPRLARDRNRRKLRTARAWRTVEELEVGSQDLDCVEFFMTPKPALRRVWNVTLAQLRKLAEKNAVLPWTMIALDTLLFDDMNRSWPSDLACIPRVLPDLREIDARKVHPIANLFPYLPKSVTRVRVRWPVTGETPDSLCTHARNAKLSELEIVQSNLFRSDKRDDVVRIVGDHAAILYNRPKPNVKHATQVIKTLAAGAIRSFEVIGATPEFAHPPWQVLRTALQKHGLG